MVVDIDGLRSMDKELYNLAGNAALKCGRFLALANTVLITTKQIYFEAHLERKVEAKLEKIPEIPEQSSSTAL